MSDQKDVLGQAADYFSEQFAKHGVSPRGVDWNERSVDQRHRQFLRLLADDKNGSVLDLGCGFGDFFRYIREHGYLGAYVGYDLLPEMIATARGLHGEGADRRWHVGTRPAEKAEYAIGSGILARKGDVPIERWRKYVFDMIDILAAAGRQGFAFNIVTLSGDPDKRRPDLYYADPVEMLDYCLKRFGRSVALLQDYGLYEFTLIVRHN